MVRMPRWALLYVLVPAFAFEADSLAVVFDSPPPLSVALQIPSVNLPEYSCFFKRCGKHVLCFGEESCGVGYEGGPDDECEYLQYDPGHFWFASCIRVLCVGTMSCTRHIDERNIVYYDMSVVSRSEQGQRQT
jgi:hypothetical protein